MHKEQAGVSLLSRKMSALKKPNKVQKIENNKNNWVQDVLNQIISVSEANISCLCFGEWLFLGDSN